MEINIKQLGPQELAVLRKEIQSSLDEIKTKYGLSLLLLGNISFDSSTFISKITGKVQNPEKENYEKNETEFFALSNGLPPDFIGSEFLLENSVFKITNIALSRPKYPITAHCLEDGRTFKFTIRHIKELLETARVLNIPYKDEGTN